jgi:hypothetical protein
VTRLIVVAMVIVAALVVLLLHLVFFPRPDLGGG